ncbi:OmpA family protein [Brevundimonas sp.]|uniref:OmpA family protein n=1 Tax=Brevundimonas sp. TaxID=1871086 RepID=UPI0028AC3850|nr:OmpA family protein [Brevundimonas sp.]
MKVFKAGVVAVAIGLAVVGCAQTPKRSSLVVGESGCQSGRFDVYFVENQARLTDAAQLLLNTAAEKARQCRVAKVRVLGLADATGASEANMTLSQQRARAVAQALTRAGMPAPVFEVAAAGDAGAVTPSGQDELLRRRTEVIVEVAPR